MPEQGKIVLWAWAEGSEGRAVAGPGADQWERSTLLSLGGVSPEPGRQCFSCCMLLLMHLLLLQ